MMSWVLMQKLRRKVHPCYFVGTGRHGRGFNAKWIESEDGPHEDAERFDTKADAMDHAKILCPLSVSRGYVEAVEVAP